MTSRDAAVRMPAVAAVPPTRAPKTAPRGDTAWRRLVADRSAFLALVLLTLLVLAAAFAPILAQHDPNAQPDPVALKNLAPSADHPFGTDPFSRDVLSRVLYGARVSLGVGVLAALLSTTLGTAYGALAGFAGGRVEQAMMRLVDAALGIPRVLLLLVIVALWGRVSTPALVAILGATGWLGTSRLARDHVRQVRTRDFVVAARALGAGGPRVLLRHVLPHLATPVLVVTPLAVGNVIALEAGLSYLGLGVRPPDPSWGSIMQDGADSVLTAWWTVAFPGALVVLTILAVNLLGDGLRDALDPRQRPR